MPFIAVAGRSLEYQWLDGEASLPRTTLVFLHEGLGSVAQWRDFPLRVTAAAGCRALVYSRYGYGQSDVLAEERAGTDFMHLEALRFLPSLLSQLGVKDPILIGHSDGASIALIHAGSGFIVKGLVLLAPHVFTEEAGLGSIERARQEFETTDLPRRLGKYHRDARKTFYLWNNAWLDPAFRQWNLEVFLKPIRVPVLAIQGENDEYGSMAQLDAIARQVSGRCELLKLPRCGHAPQRDMPEQTLAAIVKFVKKI